MERAKETLIKLLTSGKVWTAAVGLIVAFAARRGVVLAPDDVAAIKDLFITLLAAQGAQDLGKAVAASKSPVAVGGDLTVVQQQPADAAVDAQK